MPNVLIVDPEKCTTCRLCEIVCSQRKVGVYRPSRSCIRVEIDSEDAFYFPRVCIQCEDAPCIDECPTEALKRDARTGAVVLVEEHCDKCGLCAPACPYGAIDCSDGKPRKCDLCGGDPECVRFCSPGALRFEPPDNWPDKQRQAYARLLRDLAQEARA